MARRVVIALAVMAALVGFERLSGGEPVFLRGDVNGDGAVTISDGMYLWKAYRGQVEDPACLESGDVNDDGRIDYQDFSRLLEFITQRVLPPPCLPYPVPGTDPTPDGLGCAGQASAPPVEDPAARLEVSTGPVDSEGSISLTLTVSSSRPIQGVELRLSAEGNILAGGGTAGFHHLLEDRVAMGFAAGRTMADGRFIVAFTYQVEGPVYGGNGPLEPWISEAESLPVLEIMPCLLRGTPAGTYPLQVEHAEFVDVETGLPIHPLTTVEPIVLDHDLADAGCAASDSVEPSSCTPPPEPDPDPVPNLSDFIRGDANSDGRMSISDAMTIRNHLFLGSSPSPCLESMDVFEDGQVDISDVVRLLSALFLGTEFPPAPFPAVGQGSSTDGLPCDHYQIVEPASGTAVVEIGEAAAAPGELVEVPVFLTSDREAEAVQLVIAYDQRVLTPKRVTFAGTPFEGSSSVDSFRVARPIGQDLMAVGFAPDFVGEETIPAGSRQKILNIVLEVSQQATPGAAIDLVPTDGEGGQGSGPARMRNEITYRGEASFLSTRPGTVAGRLQIVGDLAIFVRGDSNGDEAVDLSDPVYTLSFLFLGGAAPPCRDAADADDDGELSISDPILALGSLFLDAGALPPPSGSPGTDPTSDALDCQGRS